ncbi:MAG: hypothetical protein WCG85_26320, partial [Polyangia bacterium]
SLQPWPWLDLVPKTTISRRRKAAVAICQRRCERSLIARLAPVAEIHAERVALCDGQRALTYWSYARRCADIGTGEAGHV